MAPLPWFVYTQVTVPPAARLMFACSGTVASCAPLDPALAVQVRLSNVKPVGSAPSVTVYEPTGTPVQDSVLAALFPLVLPLSFSENAAGVVSVVQTMFAPARFDVYENAWFNPRGSVCLRMTTVPQLLMFTGTGATKSLTSAVNDVDERLFRNTEPNASQTPGWKTPAAVRLMAASPNRLVPMAAPTNGSVTEPRLFTPP